MIRKKENIAKKRREMSCRFSQNHKKELEAQKENEKDL
ncbi:MAG: hypothetical protein CM15mP111_4720 [Hyphomicrobiales bacterium]|nr:MAG: hypothetical protein CM15mP111_4720 [Hyphomicrobiales bacterium]